MGDSIILIMRFPYSAMCTRIAYQERDVTYSTNNPIINHTYVPISIATYRYTAFHDTTPVVLSWRYVYCLQLGRRKMVEAVCMECSYCYFSQPDPLPFENCNQFWGQSTWIYISILATLCGLPRVSTFQQALPKKACLLDLPIRMYIVSYVR